MSAKQLLVAARAVIEKPENWTQAAYAREGKDGRAVSTNHPDATCFCSIGAVYRAANDLGLPRSEALSALGEQADKYGYFTIHSFNDSHTHEEVLALFDDAIAAIPG
jgi:hypothetical protein